MKSNLSQVASAVARINRVWNVDDPIADYYGVESPNDAGRLHDMRDAVVAAGWTIAEYNAELAARTSDRFAYFSGLTVEDVDVVDVADPRYRGF